MKIHGAFDALSGLDGDGRKATVGGDDFGDAGIGVEGEAGVEVFNEGHVESS